QAIYLQNNNTIFCITKSFVVDDLNNVLSDQTLRYNLGINENIQFNDVFTFKVHLPVTGMYSLSFIAEELNGFDSSLSAEDYDINLRILEKTNIGLIDQKLYFYRSPAALGQDRIRMPMRIDVSESHLLTILKYKKHPDYNIALLEWNFRRFIYFSSYINTKRYAFYGMLFSWRKLPSVFYWKALFRLIFFGKMDKVD
ncbi:glycosyltransferase family 2 protein, partial [Acinetobacter indicus]|uniref:hypothetical protein n=1 Tax=Acinetobacter indicus TaxID=756892 RepID=UPI001443BF7B